MTASTPRICQVVKAFRDSLRLTQQELSDATGISRSRVSLIESGRLESIPLEHAIALARLFEISVEQLVGEQIPVKALVIAAHIAESQLRLDAALAAVPA